MIQDPVTSDKPVPHIIVDDKLITSQLKIVTRLNTKLDKPVKGKLIGIKTQNIIIDLLKRTI